jgi:hypothetical protein
LRKTSAQSKHVASLRAENLHGRRRRRLRLLPLHAPILVPQPVQDTGRPEHRGPLLIWRWTPYAHTCWRHPARYGYNELPRLKILEVYRTEFADSQFVGSASANEGRHDGPSKGPDSEHFKKNISEQQSEVCETLLWGIGPVLTPNSLSGRANSTRYNTTIPRANKRFESIEQTQKHSNVQLGGNGHLMHGIIGVWQMSDANSIL